MAVQPQYLAYVLEQLEPLGPLHQNRMFGGVGLYSDGLFFGFGPAQDYADSSRVIAFTEASFPNSVKPYGCFPP